MRYCRLNEVDLSRDLGVSRTPLREALTQLSTEGLLRFMPRVTRRCIQCDLDDLDTHFLCAVNPQLSRAVHSPARPW
jgi:DNA-binding GntR family transcriptional regulator